MTQIRLKTLGQENVNSVLSDHMLILTNNDTRLAVPLGLGELTYSRMRDSTYHIAYVALGASAVGPCDAASIAKHLQAHSRHLVEELLGKLGWSDVWEQFVALESAANGPKPALDPIRKTPHFDLRAKYHDLSLALGLTLSQEDQKAVDDFIGRAPKPHSHTISVPLPAVSTAPTPMPPNPPPPSPTKPTVLPENCTMADVLKALDARLSGLPISAPESSEESESSPNTPEVTVTFYNAPRKPASESAESRIEKLQSELQSFQPFYEANLGEVRKYEKLRAELARLTAPNDQSAESAALSKNEMLCLLGLKESESIEQFQQRTLQTFMDKGLLKPEPLKDGEAQEAEDIVTSKAGGDLVVYPTSDGEILPYSAPKARYGVQVAPNTYYYFKTKKGAFAKACELLPQAVTIYDYDEDRAIYEDHFREEE